MTPIGVKGLKGYSLNYTKLPLCMSSKVNIAILLPFLSYNDLTKLINA